GETDEDGQYIFHPPVRGEVVVFRSPRDPDRDFVKRVIGLPGETVEIVQGTVYVNGLELVEPYLDRKDNTTMAPVDVDQGTVFVLGDNRGSSNDSRSWGPVPAENLIGRAWMRFWPLDHLGVL
ncbi:MAG: signal peptidase I, partial [Chloroflexi bacterium]|nr:signal peptidase I [Chloroflexota bacterium]